MIEITLFLDGIEDLYVLDCKMHFVNFFRLVFWGHYIEYNIFSIYYRKDDNKLSFFFHLFNLLNGTKYLGFYVNFHF